MEAAHEVLKRRLEEVERKLSELEAALPAHSVKASQMERLLRLEDEREALMKQLDQAKGLS
jgi:hypothetical protein